MKKLGFVFILLLIIGSCISYFLYQAISSENITKSYALYIPNNAGNNWLAKQNESDNFIKDFSSLQLVARLMKFDLNNAKNGYYKIEKGLNNRAFIQQLRSGRQTPIKLIYNNVRTIEDLAGNIAEQMEFDSITFLNYILSDSTLIKYNKTPENMLSLFTPNTYEVYWNTSPEKLTQKLAKETEKFWNKKDRIALLKKLEMTREEAYTLASIVEKETLVNEEKPTVAGVYINRLKRGILLQADPTVVFAVGDFTIRRVLNKHLETDNLYNTYMYPGLPPGPIYMPSSSSIDAVLNYENHNFLYFCAKPDNSGRHAFAKNLIGHNENAKRYQRWLNKQRIMK